MEKKTVYIKTEVEGDSSVLDNSFVKKDIGDGCWCCHNYYKILDVIDADTEEKSSPVFHPAHYVGNCSLECIDVMTLIFDREDVSIFCLMNAFKYLWRWQYKGGIEDLDKAEWYLDWINENGKLQLSYYKEKRDELVRILEEARKDDGSDNT